MPEEAILWIIFDAVLLLLFLFIMGMLRLKRKPNTQPCPDAVLLSTAVARFQKLIRDCHAEPMFCVTSSGEILYRGERCGVVYVIFGNSIGIGIDDCAARRTLQNACRMAWKRGMERELDRRNIVLLFPCAPRASIIPY